MTTNNLRFAPFLLLGIATLTAGAAAVACGSGGSAEDDAAPRGDASTTPSGDSGASFPPGDGGASPSGDAGSIDAGDAAPGSAFNGRADVSFTQSRFTSDAGVSYGKGAFMSVYYGDGPSGYACVRSVINPACIALACTRPADAGSPGEPVDAATDAATPNAGEVTITGGSGTLDGGIVLAPTGPMGGYLMTSATIAALGDITQPYTEAGDMLTFAAPGTPDGIGAFSLTLPAVTDVTVTRPLFTVPDGGASAPTTRIDGTADLVVGWSRGAAGTSILSSVSITTLATGFKQILQCSFDAEALQGTLPITALVPALPPVDGVATTGILGVQPWSTTQGTAGNHGGPATAPNAWTVYADSFAAGVSSSFTTTD